MAQDFETKKAADAARKESRQRDRQEALEAAMRARAAKIGEEALRRQQAQAERERARERERSRLRRERERAAKADPPTSALAPAMCPASSSGPIAPSVPPRSPEEDPANRRSAFLAFHARAAFRGKAVAEAESLLFEALDSMVREELVAGFKWRDQATHARALLRAALRAVIVDDEKRVLESLSAALNSTWMEPAIKKLSAERAAEIMRKFQPAMDAGVVAIAA